ncbi:MAG: hypothetical protein ACYDH1_16030 [Anaerolineaceae bacterium]
MNCIFVPGPLIKNPVCLAASRSFRAQQDQSCQNIWSDLMLALPP